MNTYYIKSSDEQSMWLALESANLIDRFYIPNDPKNIRPENLSLDDEWEPQGAFIRNSIQGIDLDMIGVIYKPTGNMITAEEGYQYPEMAPLDGYHANLRVHKGDLTDEQKAALPLIPPPATPSRIWAGD